MTGGDKGKSVQAIPRKLKKKKERDRVSADQEGGIPSTCDGRTLLTQHSYPPTHAPFWGPLPHHSAPAVPIGNPAWICKSQLWLGTYNSASSTVREGKFKARVSLLFPVPSTVPGSIRV